MQQSSYFSYFGNQPVMNGERRPMIRRHESAYTPKGPRPQPVRRKSSWKSWIKRRNSAPNNDEKEKTPYYSFCSSDTNIHYDDRGRLSNIGEGEVLNCLHRRRSSFDRRVFVRSTGVSTFFTFLFARLKNLRDENRFLYFL